jgi:hypothetical protein
MLDAHGQPRREFFRWDLLHLNAQGYSLWTLIIKPILLSRFGSPANAAVERLRPKDAGAAERTSPDRGHAALAHLTCKPRRR